MDYQLSQLIRYIPLARDEDAGWVQLLIFVIVAVMYALAGLARARAQKTQRGTSDDADLPPAQPPKQPFALTSSQPTRTHGHDPVRPPHAPKPSPRQPSPPISRAPAIPQKKIHIPDLSVPEPHSVVPSSSPPSHPQTRSTELSLELADTAALKRAILHYEVLGPCLALRRQHDHPHRMPPRAAKTPEGRNKT